MPLSSLPALFPSCQAAFTTKKQEYTLDIEYICLLQGEKPWQQIKVSVFVPDREPGKMPVPFHAIRPPRYQTYAPDLQTLLPILRLWLEEEFPGLRTDLSFLSRYGDVQFAEREGIRFAAINEGEKQLTVSGGKDPLEPYILFFGGGEHEHYATEQALTERIDSVIQNRVASVRYAGVLHRWQSDEIEARLRSSPFAREARTQVRFWDSTLDYDVIFDSTGEPTRIPPEQEKSTQPL